MRQILLQNVRVPVAQILPQRQVFMRVDDGELLHKLVELFIRLHGFHSSKNEYKL